MLAPRPLTASVRRPYQREANPRMKVIYLDQNHWIELSRAAHGRASRTETLSVLDTLRKARVSGRASVPLSLAHYIETLKQQTPDRRTRLANFMLELSGGMTVASVQAVVRYEIEAALQRCFPSRVGVEPFEFLGSGLTHTAGKNFGFRLEWPPEANNIPAPQRTAFERLGWAMAEHSLLSGVLPTGEPLELGPARDLTPDRWFKAALEEWRGAASRYPLDELERRIYAITLNDISNVLWEALARHKIPIEEFALLGEPRWRVLLDDMPSRRADMHLRRQWAKNAGLTPKVSDLNDWAYLGVAVSYCDIVVTEKQVADLFSRGFETRATLVAQLGQLSELVA